MINNKIKTNSRTFQIKKYNIEKNQILIQDISYGKNNTAGYWINVNDFLEKILNNGLTIIHNDSLFEKVFNDNNYPELTI